MEILITFFDEIFISNLNTQLLIKIRVVPKLKNL